MGPSHPTQHLNPRVLLTNRVALDVPSKVHHKAKVKSHHMVFKEKLVHRLPHLHQIPLKALRVWVTKFYNNSSPSLQHILCCQVVIPRRPGRAKGVQSWTRPPSWRCLWMVPVQIGRLDFIHMYQLYYLSFWRKIKFLPFLHA